ncbi:MAG: hypothetical protein LBQ52_08905 [Helicobacteraceae bacterium]|nr:hypothetical protein [Helicobacteraceae bacterium]
MLGYTFHNIQSGSIAFPNYKSGYIAACVVAVSVKAFAPDYPRATFASGDRSFKGTRVKIQQ